MRRFRSVTLITIFGLALSFSLQASSVTVNSVTGTWTSATAAPGDFPCIAGIGTGSVSWGHNAAPCDLAPAAQSGFTVTPTIPPPQNFVVPPDTGWFRLADFVHRNNQVNDPILSATLQFGVGLNIDGTPLNPAFTYTFNLNETANNPAACGAAGGTPTGQGGAGCNDIVSIMPLSPATFVVGGTTYTMNVQFSQDGTNPTSNFITLENANNTAGLYARIAAATTAVPEPATFTLAGVALLAAGIMRRRKTGLRS